jgi:hypothetical protein
MISMGNYLYEKGAPSPPATFVVLSLTSFLLGSFFS